jgi:hypothetical protein
MRHRSNDPHQQLHDAVSSLRTVGTAFLGICILIAWLSNLGAAGVLARRPSAIALASVSLFLIGPGTLYHVAAVFIHHRERWAALLAMWTALGQIALACVGVPLQFLIRDLVPVLFPALMTVFFVPALIVQALILRRSLEMIRMLPTPVRGFETIPLAQRVEETAPAAPTMAVQLIVSDRAK